MAMERVQAAGGWTALQRDCDALVATNQESMFRRYRSVDTNGLPPAIAALQPEEVWFYSPKLLRQFNREKEAEFSVVHIKIFGMHRTGMKAYPYFGLEVVSGTNLDRYTPRPSEGGASGNGYDSYSKITDKIYEITGPR